MADQTVASTTGDEPAVTALIADADAAYASAAGLAGHDRRQALLRVKDLIDKISNDYPASQASLAIALGEKVGTIDPATLEADLAAFPPDTAPGPDAMAQAPANDPLADPLLRLINQCLTAPNLPAADSGDTRVKMRLVTGANGAISGMPDLIEPSAPSQPERQLFNRSLLGLGACTDLATAQRNSTVEFSFTAAGVVDGTVLQTEAVAAVATDTATAPAAGTQDPTVTWVLASAQTQAALDLKRKDIAEIQARLIAMSYDPKGIDGAAGADLRGALGVWQSTAGIPITGYLDAAQLGRLKADSQTAFDAWQGVSDNAKQLAKASAAPKPTGRRGHNGWYRAKGGSYCRMGVFGLWCQTWKPVLW